MKEVYSVNLLDAVWFVHKTRDCVTQKTIRDWFRHAGIFQEEVSTKIKCSVATTEEDNDFPLFEWVQRIDRAHSPTFPSLHLRHCSFSNPSVILPTSQLIFQPFLCFTYITAHSPTLILLLLHHRLFTYVTWWAVHALWAPMTSDVDAP